MFIVENALKKTEGMERMRFGLIEEMPSAAKDAEEIISVGQEKQEALSGLICLSPSFRRKSCKIL